MMSDVVISRKYLIQAMVTPFGVFFPLFYSAWLFSVPSKNNKGLLLITIVYFYSQLLTELTKTF